MYVALSGINQSEIGPAALPPTNGIHLLRVARWGAPARKTVRGGEDVAAVHSWTTPRPQQTPTTPSRGRGIRAIVPLVRAGTSWQHLVRKALAPILARLVQLDSPSWTAQQLMTVFFLCSSARTGPPRLPDGHSCCMHGRGDPMTFTAGQEASPGGPIPPAPARPRLYACC